MSAVAAKEAIDIAEERKGSQKLAENVRFFRSEAEKKLSSSSRLGLFGDIPSPVIHLRYKPGFRLESAESEKRILQKIVERNPDAILFLT